LLLISLRLRSTAPIVTSRTSVLYETAHVNINAVSVLCATNTSLWFFRNDGLLIVTRLCHANASSACICRVRYRFECSTCCDTNRFEKPFHELSREYTLETASNSTFHRCLRDCLMPFLFAVAMVAWMPDEWQVVRRVYIKVIRSLVVCRRANNISNNEPPW